MCMFVLCVSFSISNICLLEMQLVKFHLGPLLVENFLHMADFGRYFFACVIFIEPFERYLFLFL